MSLQPGTQRCAQRSESEDRSGRTHRNRGSHGKREEFADARNAADSVGFGGKDRDRRQRHRKSESLGTAVEHQHRFAGPLSVLGDGPREHRPELQPQRRPHPRGARPQRNLAHLQRQIRPKLSDRGGRRQSQRRREATLQHRAHTVESQENCAHRRGHREHRRRHRFRDPKSDEKGLRSKDSSHNCAPNPHRSRIRPHFGAEQRKSG